MSKSCFKVPWKIDDDPYYPLAIIEDTPEGLGVLEMSKGEKQSDATALEWELARYIVKLHNDHLKN